MQPEALHKSLGSPANFHWKVGLVFSFHTLLSHQRVLHPVQFPVRLTNRSITLRLYRMSVWYHTLYCHTVLIYWDIKAYRHLKLGDKENGEGARK